MSWLSPYERRALQVMLRFRDDPPTLASMVVANWKAYLFLLGLFTLLGMGIWAAVYFGMTGLIPFGCGVGGILLGALLRDLASMNAAANMWAVSREVIDWRKVQQLLGDDETGEETKDS